MDAIFWALLIARVIFATGPALMSAPLLVMDLVDGILYAIVVKVEDWKDAINLWREVLFGD